METESARHNLKFFDREILRLLLKNGGHMTVNQIADTLHMSWNTAEKHLKKLEELGLTESTENGERMLWRIWNEEKARIKVKERKKLVEI